MKHDPLNSISYPNGRFNTIVTRCNDVRTTATFCRRAMITFRPYGVVFSVEQNTVPRETNVERIVDCGLFVVGSPMQMCAHTLS